MCLFPGGAAAPPDPPICRPGGLRDAYLLVYIHLGCIKMHTNRFGRKSYFIMIWPYIGFVKYDHFLLCFNRSGTGKMSVLTVRSFHGFHEIVDLIWYLPVKFMFLHKTNISSCPCN